jgi:hypothetical protein
MMVEWKVGNIILSILLLRLVGGFSQLCFRNFIFIISNGFGFGVSNLFSCEILLLFLSQIILKYVQSVNY